MEWVSKYGEILTIIVTGISLYFLLKNAVKKELEDVKKDLGLFKGESKKDIGEAKTELRKDLAEIKDKIGKVEDRLNSIDLRLTRLEGRFDERGYWESRKTGTEENRKGS